MMDAQWQVLMYRQQLPSMRREWVWLNVRAEFAAFFSGPGMARLV